VVKGYLPEARLAGPNAPRRNRIRVVIVDSSASRRCPNPLVEEYLRDHGNEFELTYTAVDKDDRVELPSLEGDIKVYTR
jgi:hypothetical protein